MASDRGESALRTMHALFTSGTVGGLADGLLLERFATRDGEAAELAFSALVERHGPMVLRVCRGILRDGHDAEDAFQATFLILARKARSVRVEDSLGPWLHGVAYNVATTARSILCRRRSREREAAERRPRFVTERDGDDLGAVVHEELNRLPGRFRSAVILCCLEGLTQQQAAQRLGWPLGTVQSRLARGRERLRVRLTRRGLAPSAGFPASILGMEAARAAVPAALASATIRAATRFAAGETAVGVVTASAAALTDGVLRTMALTKLTTVGVSGLLLCAVMTGAGLLAQTDGVPFQDRVATENPLLKYEIRVWIDGKPTGEPIVAERTPGSSVHIVTHQGRIDIRPALERVTQARAEEAAATSDPVHAPQLGNVETSDSPLDPPRGDTVKRSEAGMYKGMSKASRNPPAKEKDEEQKVQGPPSSDMMGMGGMMGMGRMPGMGEMSGMAGQASGNEGMAAMRGFGGMMPGMRGMMGQQSVNEDMLGARPGERMGDGMMGGSRSLDQRMTEMEQKLDEILRALENAMKH